jgi:hypothetical protein
MTICFIRYLQLLLNRVLTSWLKKVLKHYKCILNWFYFILFNTIGSHEPKSFIFGIIVNIKILSSHFLNKVFTSLIHKVFHVTFRNARYQKNNFIIINYY